MADESPNRFVSKGTDGVTLVSGTRRGMPLLQGRSARLRAGKTLTVTAFFDKRSDTEAAGAQLKAANVDVSHVVILDRSTPGFHATGHSTAQDPGIWSSIKTAFLPAEDRHTYEEGIRRGGFLLTVEVGGEHFDEAVRMLEEGGSIDIDDRLRQWRSSGWINEPESATGLDAATSGDGSDKGSASAEQSIPVIEESLVVGKREVDRGGVRVRSYVTEMPVHEQVRLRDEKIIVQRRVVSRPLTNADDAFRERTIDVTATSEEAVVGKTARVVEEVVISKIAGERVEEIDDNVRRTEVQIDEDKGSSVSPTYRR